MDRAERRYLAAKTRVRVYRELLKNSRLDGMLNGVPVEWWRTTWHNYGYSRRWGESDTEEKIPQFTVIYWWRSHIAIGGCRCTICRGEFGREYKDRQRGSKKNTAWRKEIWQHTWT